MGQSKYFERGRNAQTLPFNPNWQVNDRNGATELARQVLRYTIKDLKLPKDTAYHRTAVLALTDKQTLELFSALCLNMESELKEAKAIAYEERLRESLNVLKCDLATVKTALSFLKDKYASLIREWEEK